MNPDDLKVKAHSLAWVTVHWGLQCWWKDAWVLRTNTGRGQVMGSPVKNSRALYNELILARGPVWVMDLIHTCPLSTSLNLTQSESNWVLIPKGFWVASVKWREVSGHLHTDKLYISHPPITTPFLPQGLEPGTAEVKLKWPFTPGVLFAVNFSHSDGWDKPFGAFVSTPDRSLQL